MTPSALSLPKTRRNTKKHTWISCSWSSNNFRDAFSWSSVLDFKYSLSLIETYIIKKMLDLVKIQNFIEYQGSLIPVIRDRIFVDTKITNKTYEFRNKVSNLLFPVITIFSTNERYQISSFEISWDLSCQLVNFDSRSI